MRNYYSNNSTCNIYIYVYILIGNDARQFVFFFFSHMNAYNNSVITLLITEFMPKCIHIHTHTQAYAYKHTCTLHYTVCFRKHAFESNFMALVRSAATLIIELKNSKQSALKPFYAFTIFTDKHIRLLI